MALGYRAPSLERAIYSRTTLAVIKHFQPAESSVSTEFGLEVDSLVESIISLAYDGISLPR